MHVFIILLYYLLMFPSHVTTFLTLALFACQLPHIYTCVYVHMLVLINCGDTKLSILSNIIFYEIDLGESVGFECFYLIILSKKDKLLNVTSHAHIKT